MKRANIVVAVVVVVVVVAVAGWALPVYADYSVTRSGAWPASWPAELEPLRKEARTLEGPMVLYLHHAIAFSDRAAFEAAWPHLLKVRSPGAPIVLRRGASFWLGGGKAAGVCIHTPPAGEEPLVDAKQVNGRWAKTVYIELIVDGEIVDLNRIALPREAVVIDERFEEGKGKR